MCIGARSQIAAQTAETITSTYKTHARDNLTDCCLLLLLLLLLLSSSSLSCSISSPNAPMYYGVNARNDRRMSEAHNKIPEGTSSMFSSQDWSAQRQRPPLASYNQQQAHYADAQRCATPLVMHNNTGSAMTTPQVDPNRPESPSENPFKVWRELDKTKRQEEQSFVASNLPKRTVSLGPRRQIQPGDGLRRNPWLQNQFAAPQDKPQQPRLPPSPSPTNQRLSRAVNELQSSLTELNKLIDEPPTSNTLSRPRAQTDHSFGAIHKPPRPMMPPAGPLNKDNRNDNISNASVHSATSVSRRESLRMRDMDSDKENQQRAEEQMDDLANWKPSTSVTDLRSMFETKVNEVALQASRLPPSSASISAHGSMRPFPWQNPQQQQPDQLQNASWQRPFGTLQRGMGSNNSSNISTNTTNNRPQQPYADYTIRRTISTTSSRPRNPYRSHYGQF